MKPAAAAYQKSVTNVNAGTSFFLRGVKFDGFDAARKVLLDAKGPGYAKGLIQKSSGEFYPFIQDKILAGAARQIEAAKGTSIEWVFAEENVMKTVAKLFEREGVVGITLRHQTP